MCQKDVNGEIGWLRARLEEVRIAERELNGCMRCLYTRLEGGEIAEMERIRDDKGCTCG